MQNRDSRGQQGNSQYDSQSRRRTPNQNFDSSSSYGSSGSYSSYGDQEEPFDRMAQYGSEHSQERRYDITPRDRSDRYDRNDRNSGREQFSDRYRSDHDLNVSRARYDNDQDYSRDFMNRDNRNYDSRSYEGGNYDNSAYQTPSYMGERWGQPSFSSRNSSSSGQSGMYGGGSDYQHGITRTHRRYGYKPNSKSDYSSSRDNEQHSVMDDIKSFFGFGPKNYRRSDDRIKDDICEALTYDHDLDATHIDVSVKDAVVTLTGTVPQRSAKRLAEDLAEKVRGVSDVRNEIQVKNSLTDSFGSAKSPNAKNSDHLI